ncbi:MAG: ribosome-associated translation inhibitor RaiA [Bacteroidota bacterium]
MNVNITSRKFKAKDSLKEFIHEEVKSLEKFSDNILDVDVVLSYLHSKDSIKIAEISVSVPGKTLLVSEESDEFSKSVTEGVDKLKRQLKKVKSKRLEKRIKNES